MKKPSDDEAPWGDNFKEWYDGLGEPDDKTKKPEPMEQIAAVAQVDYLPDLRILRPGDGAYIVCEVNGNQETAVPIHFKSGKNFGVTPSALVVIAMDHLRASKDPEDQKAVDCLAKAMRWMFIGGARKQLLSEK